MLMFIDWTQHVLLPVRVFSRNANSAERCINSRHHEITLMSMYITDTFCLFTRNVSFKSCFLLSEKVRIELLCLWYCCNVSKCSRLTLCTVSELSKEWAVIINLDSNFKFNLPVSVSSFSFWKETELNFLPTENEWGEIKIWPFSPTDIL